MKTASLILTSGLFATSLFGQGSIRFDNRVTGTTTSAVVAPIYNYDPSDPTTRKTGNAASGPTTPIPTGTQTYNGAPLTGTGWTASLWARPAGSSGSFVFAASTPFRATTSTTLFGFWTTPALAVVLPNVPSDPGVRAEIIIRVWDNKGGTITSWDQLYDPNTGAPLNFNAIRSESLAFIVPDQLGGGTVLPPTLRGLQSFQMFLVPEPAVFPVIVLGLVSVCFLRLRRRR